MVLGVGTRRGAALAVEVRVGRDVQRRLGFALTPNETSGTITIQPFERGLMLASNLGTPTVYIFYQNNLFEAYPR